MRRFITAFALLTITLTAAACDPVAAIDDRFSVPSPDPGPGPCLSGSHTQTLPADLPNTNR